MTSILRSVVLAVDSLDRAEALFAGLLGGTPTALDASGRRVVRFRPVSTWSCGARPRRASGG